MINGESIIFAASIVKKIYFMDFNHRWMIHVSLDTGPFALDSYLDCDMDDCLLLKLNK